MQLVEAEAWGLGRHNLFFSMVPVDQTCGVNSNLLLLVRHLFLVASCY